jgi:GNAT superfamily N-acetyltransferase
MPRFVEQLAFDTKLFGQSIGRIDLCEKDCELLLKYPTIHDILGHANSAGYKLIYIFAPVLAKEEMPTNNGGTSKYKFLGEKFDVKTVFSAPLTKFDRESALKMAFFVPDHKNIRIRRYEEKLNKDFPNAIQQLMSLAVASGAYSRFKLDKRLPEKGFEGMFHAWLANSMNRSIADEVFIAYDAEDSSCIVGFITLKRKELNVNIGLLSVAASHRRMGIGNALLSRALMWALEEIGWSPRATMNVVTQGSNEPACKCYERFGYELESTQDVYHCWLPEHLERESRADTTLIPFCKQHFTGKEQEAVAQVFATGLDSASHFTLMCSSHICDMLGDDSTRVVMVPSGTAALEMAALLCDLKPGDEVIMPSYTFSSTANAFVLRGAVPVFVDV